MKTIPQNDSFGVILDDLNLNTISDTDINQIHSLLHKYKVVSILHQDLNIQDFQNFSEKVGSLVSHRYTKHVDRLHPYIDIINKQENDTEGLFGGTWHTDSSFENRPPDFTCLYGEIIPDVLNITSFGDSVNGYDTLSKETKDQIESLNAIHSIEGLADTKVQDMFLNTSLLNTTKIATRHPVVSEHPHTKQRYLNVNLLYTKSIETYNEEESEELLYRLYRHQLKKRYDAIWEKGMVLIWDNRLVVHKAIKCIGHRKILRAMLNDDKIHLV